MPDPVQKDWFSGRPGRLLVYRVNRRPKGEDSLFPTELPSDSFDHFVRVLAPGYEVVSGRGHQRVWRAGGLQIDRDQETVTGRLGWQPLGTEDVTAPKWMPDEMDWRLETTDPEEHLLPFGFDGESRLLTVVRDRSSNPTTIGGVFERILRENESELEDPTTDWAVEPVLDARNFLDWLHSQDVVQSVSFTAKLPNPSLDEPFKELAERLQRSHATKHTETMVSQRDEGLVEVEQDRDFGQAIAMAQRGFALLRGKGKRGGKKTTYSQKQTQATESVEELPDNWGEMRSFLIEQLQGPLRRYKDEQG